MSFKLLYLSCFLKLCIGVQFIYKDEPWQAFDGNITCDETEGGSCIIQCSGEYSCGSFTDSKPYIICPENGALCIINCVDQRSCTNNIILAGGCDHVEINVQEQYNDKMTINSPNNGDLYINVISIGATFDNNIINVDQTNNLIMDCSGKGSCQRNIINAESIRNNLNISCRNGANCDQQEIHCPDNNKDHLNPRCNLLCDNNGTSCFDMNIFAMNGTKKRNGVTLKCDPTEHRLCDESRIHCSNDRVCDMKYDYIINEWYCDGICGDKIITTSAPSSSPTVNPTVSTSNPTTSSVSTIGTAPNETVDWFALPNTTMFGWPYKPHPTRPTLEIVAC